MQLPAVTRPGEADLYPTTMRLSAPACRAHWGPAPVCRRLHLPSNRLSVVANAQRVILYDLYDLEVPYEEVRSCRFPALQTLRARAPPLTQHHMHLRHRPGSGRSAW